MATYPCKKNNLANTLANKSLHQSFKMPQRVFEKPKLSVQDVSLLHLLKEKTLSLTIILIKWNEKTGQILL